MAKKAFTLIELLVVIAIIAILAAILFPVFAQAKAAAKKAASLSNVKQIMTAVLMYGNDYDDGGPIRWGFPNGNYATGSPMDVHWHTWMDGIDPYAKNKEIWLDKGASITNGDVGYSGSTGGWNFKLVSNYVWVSWIPYLYWGWFDGNAKYAGFPTSSNPVTNYWDALDLYISTYGAQCNDIGHVEFPAESAFIIPGYYVSAMPPAGDPLFSQFPFGDAWTTGFQPYDTDPNFNKINPYQGGSNVGYCDGHAKYVGTKAFHGDMSVTGSIAGRKGDKYMRMGSF